MTTGVAVGMGMVGMQSIADMGHTFREKGYRKVSPHFIPMVLVNMAAGHVSLKYGFQVNHLYFIVLNLLLIVGYFTQVCCIIL